MLIAGYDDLGDCAKGGDEQVITPDVNTPAIGTLRRVMKGCVIVLERVILSRTCALAAFADDRIYPHNASPQMLGYSITP
jgi:hypothetical protein